jgi:hypothetical protein
MTRGHANCSGFRNDKPSSGSMRKGNQISSEIYQNTVNVQGEISFCVVLK